jgi:tRNA pseudouridine55 synthase
VSTPSLDSPRPLAEGLGVGAATGILNVYKEPGWTSHDVVAKVRRLAGQKRVGHAGTLDPLAEGVLPVLLGRATRLADAIQSGEKRYQAWIQLGVATTTDDAEGEITARHTVPPLTAIDSILGQFRGTIAQVPPSYSAIKVNGRRAYAMARRGETPELAPRQVTITDLRLLESSADCLALEVACSKGTYIRALARDIAAALGTVGHLTRLVRTQVGPFRLEHAVRLPRMELLPPEAALPDAPVYHVTAEEAPRLLNGQAIASTLVGDTVRVHDPSGRLVCLGSADGELLRPRIVL